MAARRMSVVICTRNRARLLAGTLESLCRACAPRHLEWEVIVVLNNCTDSSREVVETFRGRLPIVAESELRTGLSHARNRAIDRASGDVIVWIDDDVRVSTEWLCAYEQAFLGSDWASFFGGPILPSFEGTPPNWLLRHWHLCETAFAVRQHVPAGNPDITLATKHRPFGANFAVRAKEQQRHRYDPRLGSQPGRTLWAGEETKVIRDILAAGGRGRWVSAALVHHVMPPERQTSRYLRAYFQSYGVRVGLMSRQRLGSSGSPADLPTLADVVRAECRFRWLRAVAGPDRWIPALKKAARTRGRWLARYEEEDAIATQATASPRASDAPLT